jgi:hypothetical protein
LGAKDIISTVRKYTHKIKEYIENQLKEDKLWEATKD